MISPEMLEALSVRAEVSRRVLRRFLCGGRVSKGAHERLSRACKEAGLPMPQGSLPIEEIADSVGCCLDVVRRFLLDEPMRGGVCREALRREFIRRGLPLPETSGGDSP